MRLRLSSNQGRDGSSFWKAALLPQVDHRVQIRLNVGTYLYFGHGPTSKSHPQMFSFCTLHHVVYRFRVGTSDCGSVDPSATW
jgi:hypothetical protein